MQYDTGLIGTGCIEKRSDLEAPSSVANPVIVATIIAGYRWGSRSRHSGAGRETSPNLLTHVFGLGVTLDVSPQASSAA